MRPNRKKQSSSIMKRVELSFFVGWMLIACGPVVTAVASEPLGTVPPGALVLDQDWQMQSSTLIGDAGASLSTPGQLTAACYKTKVPTTVLGALIRHGVYPDPYVGTNNMFAIMQEYFKIGYKRTIYPEHPRFFTRDAEFPGYVAGRGYPGGGGDTGQVFNVAYARAMMQAAMSV